MKKLISLITAILILTYTGAMAAQNPTVSVNGSDIMFADQNPVIKDDRTLVPARGVFEAMGAKVQWEGEAQRVQIDSADNFTRVFMTIGTPNLRIYKFKDIYSADRYIQEIDVAPQIINDRTMLPLRAVADAFGCDVQWDGDARHVTITTKEGAPEVGKEIPYVYLSTQSSDVKEGDTFDVYVNMKNFNKDTAITSGSVAIKYDNNAFEYVSSAMADSAGESAMMAANPDFDDNTLIVAFAKAGYDLKVTDGAYIKVTFKALNNDGGAMHLSKFFETSRGYMTNIGLVDSAKNIKYSYNALNMGVDTTEITLK